MGGEQQELQLQLPAIHSDRESSYLNWLADEDCLNVIMSSAVTAV